MDTSLPEPQQKPRKVTKARYLNHFLPNKDRSEEMMKVITEKLVQPI